MGNPAVPARPRSRTLLRAAALLLATAAWLAAALGAEPTQAEQQLGLAPVADAYVDVGDPNTNFGAAPTLEVDGSAVQDAYLLFDLPPLAGAVVSARLRLYVVDSGDSAVSVAPVADTAWEELRITYASRPAVGAPVATLPAFNRGAWVEASIPPGALGDGGRRAFALRVASANGISFASREDAARAPQLLVVVDGAVTPTPSRSPTGTPTPTATPTTAAGATATRTPTATPGSAPTGVFPAKADAYVDVGDPGVNFGAEQTLQVDGSAVQEAYLLFDLPPLGGNVSARLRLYVVDSGDSAVSVAPVADTAWEELRITYASRPAMGAPVATLPAFNRGAWVEADVPASAIGVGGRRAFGLRVASANGVSFASREDAARAPQLLLLGDAAVTPGPSATPSPTGAPSGTPTLTPTPTQTATGGGTGSADPVIAAAGDVACGSGSSGSSCRQMATSDLLVRMDPAVVLALGDTQYERGGYSDFQGYWQPSWGRLKAKTRPAVGNHEYGTSGAAGYFDYFNGVGNRTGPAGDRSMGYYAFDVGAWRLYALNSNCSYASCSAGGNQEVWLRADLAANPRACTLMYMHHPMWTSDTRDFDKPELRPLFQAFYDHGGELVLVGHSHFYERFARSRPDQSLDAAYGFRQVIVGTGGRNVYGFGSVERNSEVRNGSTFGVLKVTLRPTSYTWEFVPVDGQSFRDAGSEACHGPRP